MDKYEYKVRSEEIKELIAQREYERAAEIADTIDWRRVKSVMMLCTISDLYKINRRYEDSRDLLLLAYDRHPGGRTIVYALCELSIKMGELPQAVEYCKEFVSIAPRDPGRYILQYKIYEAQGVSIEERIEVLEELKKHDYREKWAYELAYLYHRIGLASKCVDECDEMIVWFGDGKFVIRAMELKMLHQPLTPEQQWKYDNRFAPVEEEEQMVEEPVQEATVIEEIPMDMIPGQDEEPEEDAQGSTTVWSSQEVAVAMVPLDVDISATKTFPVEEIDIQIKTMDPSSQYNTINLQEEVAAGLRELLENDSKEDEITRAIVAPMMKTDSIDSDAVTKVLISPSVKEESESIFEEQSLQEEATIIWSKEEVAEAENTVEEEVEEALSEEMPEEIPEEMPEADGASNTKRITTEPHKDIAKVLSMEADGQISFVVPEKEAVEQQITGQLSIADIMAEWERMKKELEEKGKEKVRQHVKENTGQMFTEFEASVRDGLLEQLEGGRGVDSVIAEAEGRTFDEDEIPVPPSLMDEAEEEDSINGYEEISVEEAESAVDSIDEVPEEPEVVDEIAKVEEEPEVVEEIAEVEEEPEVVEEIAEATEESEVQEEATDEEILTSEDVVEELVDIVDVEEAEVPETEEEELPEAEIEEEIENEIAEEIEELEASESEGEESEEEYTLEEMTDVEQIPTKKKIKKVRSLTKEERELFGPYIQGRSSKEQLIHAIDNISMAAYTGNVIITGVEGLDTLGLAKNIIREVQMTDSNFSGKTAKISGEALNKRSVNDVLGGLQNGALIIQRAFNMNSKTVEELYKALQQESSGIIVIMEGIKKPMNTFLAKNAKLKNCFTARIDMEALSDAALVTFCKKYARENEFAIDELAVLALHQIITDRQTNDHAVTIMEVKEIMDEAMESAGKKSVGHFFDVLMAKRYDEEDMIIIREKDFM